MTQIEKQWGEDAELPCKIEKNQCVVPKDNWGKAREEERQEKEGREELEGEVKTER